MRASGLLQGGHRLNRVRASRTRLRLEVLEDRVVPSNIPVGLFSNEPTLAVNPFNANNVAVANYNQGSETLKISNNGGVSFPITVNAFPQSGFFADGDDSLAFDSAGRLFWSYLRGPGVHVMVQQINPTTGALIGTPVDAAGTSNNDKAWIAADHNPASAFKDDLYIAWNDFTLPGAAIKFARSTNQGLTWTTMAGTMSGSNEGFTWPAEVEVGPNGDVWVAWHVNANTQLQGGTRMRRSTDGGATFGPEIIPFPNGTSDVNLNAGSAEYNPPVPPRIDHFKAWLQGSNQPRILVDPARPGNIYVITPNGPTGAYTASGDPSDIAIARSTDNGATWTRGTIGTPNDGKIEVMPSAAIDPNGNIAVTWYQDLRPATDPQGDWLLGLFGTTSSDGGVTFAPGFQVTDATNAFDPDLNAPDRFGNQTLRIGEYNGVAVANGNAYAVWTGNEPTGQRRQSTYFDAFLVQPAGPSVNLQVPATDAFGHLSSLRVGFDEAIDVSTFTPAKIVSFTGPGGSAITVTGVSVVAGTNNKQFDISFGDQITLGAYTIVLGPDIKDTFGHQMDQDHNGIPGEIPGDRYAGHFNVQGLQVTASTPALDHVRLTFNEPVDPNTLTPDQIVAFTGPAGPIDLSNATMTVVAASNKTQVDVNFDPQSAFGNYDLTVGPAIQDLFGHKMDQDGNFSDGEVPGDQYHAKWTIVQPKIIADSGIAHGASFLPGALSSVQEQVTFNESMDPNTFTPDQVVINGASGSSFTATSVTPVAGSNNTRFTIAFIANATDKYTMVIGPNILDVFGHAADPYSAITFNVFGPKIITGTGIIPGFSYLPGALSTVLEQVTFNEPMDPNTFTPDQVVLNGPGGVSYSADTVTPVAGSNNTAFNIAFTANVTGRYTMVIGPNILDPFGNAMDQDGNFIPGEVPGDQFTVPFNVLGPRGTFGQVLGDFTNNIYNAVRVSFNESMDPTTFGLDQASLKGPGNVTIPVAAISPVAGTNNTQFDVSFAPQGKIGNYTLTVGPNILDTFGNAMDQDGNLITGEIPGDQFVVPFSVNGPRVNFTSPSTSLEPVNTLRVFFSKPMDVTTFTAAKIVSFGGPGGPIGIDAILAVPGSNFTQFDLDFKPQTATGTYTMVLGPDIRDLFGNQMDQDGNLIDGEIPGDRFTATFSLQGLRITTSPNGGNSLPGLDHVRLTFNEPVNPSTFTPSTIVSFTGPGGPIPVTGVSAVPLTDNTQFDVSFDPLGTTGTPYTLVVAPTMTDVYGNKLDQDNNGIPGEDPADRFTYTFGVSGLRVLASSPSGGTKGTVDHVRVTFNEAVDPTTFTSSSIVSFTGPAGAIPVTGVNAVDATNTVFDVTFGPQSALGSYTMVLSETIQDAFGNQMDQDNNLIPGENPGDRYTAQFTITLLNNGDFEDGGGSLTGWTVQNKGSGNWFVQSGTFSPLSGFLVPAPPGPTHAAMTDSFGAGSHVLYQDFVVPAGLSTASISFDLFIGNRYGAFFTPSSLDPNVSPNQQARVDIITTTADPFSVNAADVLLNLYQTKVGDPAISGYTTRTTDLTSVLALHKGQTVRLRFAEVDDLSYFQFGVDRVNLVINTGGGSSGGGGALPGIGGASSPPSAPLLSGRPPGGAGVRPVGWVALLDATFAEFARGSTTPADSFWAAVPGSGAAPPSASGATRLGETSHSEQGAGRAARGPSGSGYDKDALAEPFHGMSGAKDEGNFWV